MTEIEKHIKECEHRVAVIVGSGFSKSDIGKENIRILTSAIEACKKQMPMKIGGVETYNCPSCDKMFTKESYPYCPWCGQAIDWGKHHF